jgi:hypothetical protein
MSPLDELSDSSRSVSFLAMNTDYFAMSVQSSELMPVISRFAKAVHSPDDLVDLFANLLWPPRPRPKAFAGQAALPG